MIFGQFLDFANNRRLLDIRGGGIAQLPLPAHAVPLAGAAVDRHRRAGRQLRDDPPRRGRIFPQIQAPRLGAYRAAPRRDGCDKRQPEILRQGQYEVGGDGLDAALYPAGVGVVVVVSQLQQHGGHPGPPHLPQRGGGAGIDLLRQRVDGLEVPHEDVGGTLAVGAAGVVEGDDAPDEASRLPSVLALEWSAR